MKIMIIFMPSPLYFQGNNRYLFIRGWVSTAGLVTVGK
jgi:hypothetical protein